MKRKRSRARELAGTLDVDALDSVIQCMIAKKTKKVTDWGAPVYDYLFLDFVLKALKKLGIHPEFEVSPGVVRDWEDFHPLSKFPFFQELSYTAKAQVDESTSDYVPPVGSWARMSPYGVVAPWGRLFVRAMEEFGVEGDELARYLTQPATKWRDRLDEAISRTEPPTALFLALWHDRYLSHLLDGITGILDGDTLLPRASNFEQTKQDLIRAAQYIMTGEGDVPADLALEGVPSLATPLECARSAMGYLISWRWGKGRFGRGDSLLASVVVIDVGYDLLFASLPPPRPLSARPSKLGRKELARIKREREEENRRVRQARKESWQPFPDWEPDMRLLWR